MIRVTLPIKEKGANSMLRILIADDHEIGPERIGEGSYRDPPARAPPERGGRLAARRQSRRRFGSSRRRTRFGCGDDGYRIPTPAEDDWERLRNGINPKPGDSHRLYSEVLAGFWQPQPSHTLFDTKTFKAGLAIHGREVTTATWCSRSSSPKTARSSRPSRPSCARAASRSARTSSGPSR